MERINLNDTTSGCTMYNGVLMTKKQIADLKKSANKPKAKKKLQYNEYRTISEVVERMVKKCTCIRQFQSYYIHGHRAWGKTYNDIICTHKNIRLDFGSISSLTYKINNQLANVVSDGKKCSKLVNNDILRLSWTLDKYLIKLNHLVNEIIASNVMDLYKDHEAINGVGRRLGLKILVERSSNSIKELTNIINSLQILSKDGDKALVRKATSK